MTPTDHAGHAQADGLLQQDARQDAIHMARAIQLAARGLYTTDPNPRVGCVLVRQGERVGEGWHVCAGQAHAEVAALQMAGEAAKGATAYVSLEPCSHHGKTPPCADALIQAGISRVVVAGLDPNPQVQGRGVARLRAAGIEVVTGLQAAQAEALNPGFLKRMRTGLPWVRVKLAASLDGRAAMASGESQWITGPQARADVQRLRARSSAIVTGAATVLADNPRLNVRAESLPDALLPLRQPQRWVLDRRLSTSPTARVYAADGQAFLVASKRAASSPMIGAFQQAGVQVIAIDEALGGLDLQQLLSAAAGLQLNELLVEAGPRLAGAFIEQGLVDEIWLYQAPLLLGSQARPMACLPFERLDQGIRLKLLERRQLGDDTRSVFSIARDGSVS